MIAISELLTHMWLKITLVSFEMMPTMVAPLNSLFHLSALRFYYVFGAKEKKHTKMLKKSKFGLEREQFL